MGYKVPFGQRIEAVQIAKANVVKGFPGRALMLGPDCVMGKALYYDDRVKRTVEVTQDAIIKYHFDNVREYYYIAIARLNTDMQGNIVSNDIKVEYVRLTGDMYNDLCTQLRETPHYTSLLLEKVEKRGDDGKDFSWVKVSLSSVEIPQAVAARVQQLVETPGAVDSIMQMLDSQTSITIEEYEKRLATLAQAAPQLTVIRPKQVRPTPAPAAASAPSAPANAFSDLGGDFGDFEGGAFDDGM